MKMLKIGIAAASLTLASTQVLADLYVDGGFTGTATIKSSGGCKSSVTYTNASYGSIYDDATDSYVGYGLLSSTGEILVLEEEYTSVSSSFDVVTHQGSESYFEDMASQETMNTVAANSMCNLDTMVSNPNSRETYKKTATAESGTLKFNFSGYVQTTYVTKGTKQIGTGKKYSGSVTFKGSKPLV